MSVAAQDPTPARIRPLPKRLAALLIGTLVALMVATAVLRNHATRLGAHIVKAYLCAPRPGMWVSDPDLGYVNKPYLDRRAFGGIVGRTNGQGFRTEEDVAPEKPSGTLRIFGVGDSVMWGTQVDAEKSILGALGRLMRESGTSVETINAGVVGYSTYQERVLLELRVLRYDPDIVVVNYCPNDHLPSEDPFANIRSLTIDLVEGYLRGECSLELDASERAALLELLRILKAPGKVRPAVQRAGLDRGPLLKPLVLAPILEMKRLTEARAARLVYLFIPSRQPREIERELQLEIQRFLSAHGIEFLDLREDFARAGGADAPTASRGASLLDRALGWPSRSGLERVLSDLRLAWLNPLPSIRRLRRYAAHRRMHTQALYVDDLHPTERGNALIARRLFEYLTE